jgi:hypothetical protein
MALPVDGEDLDVASVWQCFKEAADFIAYLQRSAGWFLASRSRWVGAEAASLPAADWTLADGTGEYRAFQYDGSGTTELFFTLSLTYGVASYEKLTAASLQIYKDGAAITTVKVYKLTGLGGGTPALTLLGSQTSTTVGDQIITVSGLADRASDTQMLVLSVSGGATQDQAQAVKMTYIETAV